MKRALRSAHHSYRVFDSISTIANNSNPMLIVHAQFLFAFAFAIRAANIEVVRSFRTADFVKNRKSDYRLLADDLLYPLDGAFAADAEQVNAFGHYRGGYFDPFILARGCYHLGVHQLAHCIP